MGRAAEVVAPSSSTPTDGGCPVAQVNDLSRSLTAFDPISTLVVVVEMSPGKTIGQHHHAMRLSVPFPNQQSARCQGRSLSVQALQPVRHRRTRLVRTGVIQNLSELMIEIAMTISLDSKSQDRKQQMPATPASRSGQSRNAPCRKAAPRASSCRRRSRFQATCRR